MPEITVSQVGTIADRRIKALADDVATTVRLAAEKATVNAIDPAQYPLSRKQNSLERIFSARLRSKYLTASQKGKAALTGQDLVAMNAKQRRSVYGRLASVNLKDQTAVEDQVAKMSVPAALTSRLTSDYVEAAPLATVSIAPAILRSPLLPRPPRFAGIPTRLEFRVHELFCADETDGVFGTEWGSDEMHLGGSAIDATGVTTKIDQFKVADFDDGDVHTWASPKVMTTFDLTRGTDWPKTYFFVLALAEEDGGGFSKYLDDLVNKIAEVVKDKLAAWIGVGVGVASGGPIGAVIGFVVGYVVGKAIEWLKAWWNDEIFAPVTVNVEIAGNSARFGGAVDSPNVVARMTGHGGDYRLTYDWRLANFTAFPVKAT
jgi:hypothetical protein